MALVFLVVPLVGCTTLFDWVGGNFDGKPSELEKAISPGARELIAKAFAEVGRERLVDIHVHVFGDGPDEGGPFVSPTVRSLLHPFRIVQFRVYLSASGVTSASRLNEQYVERLVALARNMGGRCRFFLCAMDRHYRPDGTPDLNATPFYVPNEYVWSLAQRYPDLFVPVVSIHPYRKDALENLETWAKRGCLYVKWLSTSQGIDPSSPQTEPFYRKMREFGMVLLAHSGEELAVFSGGRQELGNPLLLRKPLDMGVRVVALHSASFGKSIDLESPGRPKVPSFDLFLRLMDDPRYKELLYGDIAGVIFIDHSLEALRKLLAREDLHPRLLNGSDYPLPAVNFLVMTGRLANHGFITGEEREFLNEIYRYNPLLFDFVVKRTLRHPETGRRFAPAVFILPPELPLPVEKGAVRTN